MKTLGTRVIDISDYGYDEPVVFKELTLMDSAKMNIEMRVEKKKYDGEVPDALANIILLKFMMKSAPFEITNESIGDLPLTLGTFLVKEANEMLRPLLNPKLISSDTTTEEEKPMTETSEEQSTDLNS